MRRREYRLETSAAWLGVLFLLTASFFRGLLGGLLGGFLLSHLNDSFMG